MKIAAITDIGSCRQENQDNYCAQQLAGGTAWGIVCDGMGGVNGGRIAARIATDTMQIDENLALAARRGLPRTLKIGITKKEHDTYYELLKTLDLGLEERMTSKVGLLSGGQRQAVTLLMATLKKPKLLLLDEHTAALDPKTAAKVLTLSEKIVEENHLTTLMITHNMKDAIKYGNRLIMMYEGHIIYDVRGEEKKNLQVSDLLKRFEQVSDGEFANDRMLLS